MFGELNLQLLKAIISQAKENTQKVQDILSLYELMKNKIVATTHSQYAIQVLDAIFAQPIFKTSDFIKRTGITKTTAMDLLKQIRESGDLQIIRQACGRQAAILVYPALLNITEGKKLCKACRTQTSLCSEYAIFTNTMGFVFILTNTNIIT